MAKRIIGLLKFFGFVALLSAFSGCGYTIAVQGLIAPDTYELDQETKTKEGIQV